MNLKPGCAVLTAVLFGACSERPERLAGDYKLVGTINSPVPVVLQFDGNCPVRLESGSLAFRDDEYDSTFRIVRHCPEQPDSVVPDPGAHGGSYVLTGDTLIFHDDAGNPAGMGFRKGDTLTITGPQHTLVYVRD